MSATRQDERPSGAKGERIAKRLARAGLCSRREAERWIEAGRVAVDGKVLTSPAVVVGPGNRITVDDKPLPAAEATRLWRYHKPKGLICTARDEAGRPTVFDALPAELPRVMSVGRLDFNSEGLLLLTNDGGLARRLELPSTGWARRYRVRVFGRPDPEKLAALAHGVTVEGVHYGPIEAALERQQGGNAWISLLLREGKNREIRKVMEHLGLVVNRLIRISFGPFRLTDLESGSVREVPPRILADQLGTKPADREPRPTTEATAKTGKRHRGNRRGNRHANR
ncbi:MAG: rRNA pseudouridine synthase, partial [Proteobacteria bacterium]|nr:rRNA pseudouridine synthase [Pseudomonadota bacterium]